ncbi:MAG: SdpI family protein [Firmicutes bacterium]|nr:SdpI family protein [Bacillota bacterium]
MYEETRRFTALDAVFWAAWVALAVVTAAEYSHLPARVPTHWDVHGRVDGTMPKGAAAALYIALPVLVYALMRVLPGFDPLRGNYARFAPSFGLIRAAIGLVLTVISAAALAAAAGRPVAMDRVAPVAVGLMLAVIGNVLSRVRPNWFVGIRTPWTLSDEEVWRRTHRFGGYAFVAAGLVMAGLGLAGSAWALGGVLVVCAAAAATVVYSYMVWRSRRA